MNRSIMKQSRGVTLLKALFIAYVITGAFMLFLALAMARLEMPDIAVNAGIIFSYIFSSFIGGLIVGKHSSQKRFLWGIILGMLYFAIIFAVSILMQRDIMGEIGSMITVFFMCSLGGMLGGMLS
ncbi:TIGR04086 family membrane protein [Anaeromicropila populeti]|uniref:Putative membrane protein, TIGR04086 family n=1 Tax=Anaeromicropila populeti TaxID=37658 RepID=A0A1I6IQU7_9FIRM|nr:TIGR04086 family membrane protein [Anaeromicropila populeti]SFR69103.1 putative membrane protein, TIGR04086 family [Anaeromicropila populeti]